MALALIPVVALAAAGAAGLRGVLENFNGLRAKLVAQRVLAQNTEADPSLRKLALQFHAGQLPDAEVRAAAETISRSLRASDVSERLLRYVHQGLNQSNVTSERRYIEDLMNRA